MDRTVGPEAPPFEVPVPAFYAVLVPVFGHPRERPPSHPGYGHRQGPERLRLWVECVGLRFVP